MQKWGDPCVPCYLAGPFILPPATIMPVRFLEDGKRRLKFSRYNPCRAVPPFCLAAPGPGAAKTRGTDGLT